MSLFIDQETIRITRSGAWLSNEQEITHGQTLRAYKRHLGRDDQGYFVRIGRDFKRIEVEDTAWFVELAWLEPESGKFRVRLSDESELPLAAELLKYTDPGRLTLLIREGEEEARFLTQAYHWTLLHLPEESLKALARASETEG